MAPASPSKPTKTFPPNSPFKSNDKANQPTGNGAPQPTAPKTAIPSGKPATVKSNPKPTGL